MEIESLMETACEEVKCVSLDYVQGFEDGVLMAQDLVMEKITQMKVSEKNMKHLDLLFKYLLQQAQAKKVIHVRCVFDI